MNYYSTINKKFSFLRVFGKIIIPSEVEFSIDLYTQGNQEETSIAVKKIHLLVDNVFENAIFIHYKSELIDMFMKNDEILVDNNIVLLPSEPMDDILAALIFSKLKAISENILVINSINLTSSLFYESSITFEENSNEYIENFEYIENNIVPWWKRNDFTSRDYICKHEDGNEPDLEILKIKVSSNEDNKMDKNIDSDNKGTEIINIVGPRIKLIDDND